MKNCSKCNIEKLENDFYKNKSRQDGLAGICKSCQDIASKRWQANNKERVKYNTRTWRENNKDKMREYTWIRQGLDPQIVKSMLEQSNGCEICGSFNKLVPDHDHETNKLRGILCDKCNRALGMLGDNIAGISKVLEYLQN